MLNTLHCSQKQYPGLGLKSGDGRPDAKVRIRTEKKFGIEEEHVISCKNCGNPITTPESIISVDGKHIHSFTNPAGIIFEISCFSSADGCIVIGDSTLEHTWFEGFDWSFSHCSACLIHLGWFYQSKEESFFGLILNLLADIPKTH
jgi:hypothetical protein